VTKCSATAVIKAQFCESDYREARASSALRKGVSIPGCAPKLSVLSDERHRDDIGDETRKLSFSTSGIYK
jgi:hypothetical protein